MVRHAGAAPATVVWKTTVFAVTLMTLGKWWLRLESHQAPLVFSEMLISLSYAAVVPPRGNAPRSSADQADALLLSYGGGWSPDEVMLPGLPDVSRPFSF